MGRGSETQLQVGENLNPITWRFTSFFTTNVLFSHSDMYTDYPHFISYNSE